MKRSRKSNSVSWAPGVNLCQVKLFLTDDCPSKVGGECRDTLQGKTSRSLYPNNLPPGFEGGHHVNGLKYDLAQMPRIPWTCPPKFVLNSNWRVAAAEESKEVEAQKLREMRVLEAVYPRLSAIPPNPSVSLDLKVKPDDDSQTPLLPLTPIEDEEGADISSDFAAQEKTPSDSQRAALVMSQGLSESGIHSMPQCPASSAAKLAGIDILPGVNSDVIVAASAALTAVTKGEEQGSMIDTDLLVKILSDPKMVEKLINDRGYLTAGANEGKTGICSLPCPKSGTVSSPEPADRNSNHFLKELYPTNTISNLPIPASREDMVSVSMSKRVDSKVPLPCTDINMIPVPGHRAANGNGNAYFTLNQAQAQPAHSMMPIQPNFGQEVQPTINSTTLMQVNAGLAIPAPAMKANPNPNPVKDINYFKNLIREHGRDKQEAEGHNISQAGAHSNHTDNPQLVKNLKPVPLNTKFRKPCMYFNSSRGCRNGSNCTFIHDKSFQTLEAASAKRVKLNCEITGRI